MANRYRIVDEIKKAVRGEPSLVELGEMTPEEAEIERRIRATGTQWAFGSNMTRLELCELLESGALDKYDEDYDEIRSDGMDGAHI